MELTLRRATALDAPAVARVHVRSWQAGYAGLIDGDYLAGLDPVQWAQRYTFDAPGRVTTIALDGAEIVGLATISTARRVGELSALYVDADRWGGGVGTVLLDTATAQLRDAGFGAAELWVLRGNDRAMRFYRSHGWRPDGRVREEVGRGGIVHVDEGLVRSLAG